jgi:hypothetical protein
MVAMDPARQATEGADGVVKDGVMPGHKGVRGVEWADAYLTASAAGRPDMMWNNGPTPPHTHTPNLKAYLLPPHKDRGEPPTLPSQSWATLRPAYYSSRPARRLR